MLGPSPRPNSTRTRTEQSRPDGGGGGGGGGDGGVRARVALFKTFCGIASMCKQIINHAVPRIKQSNSLLYDFLLHCENRSRIHPKIWLPVPIPKYPQYWLPVPILFKPTDYQCQYFEFPTILDVCPNSSATEIKGEKRGRKCIGRDMGGGEKEKSK
ncbi:hypothetical protein Lal_00008266 [Lupinus albus]|nr:hypothetical protein Lal_00008266 [Lupinus albus]